MQKLVFINGSGTQIDLTANNFGITNWSGLSNTGLNIQTQQVPFEDGGVFLDALMEQREIEVTVAIYDGNNLALRYEKKRELISALNPKLGEGTLIYTNDFLSKQIRAVPQIPLFENKNSNDAGTLKASVAFSCPNPYWEDTEETEVTITETGVIINNEGDVDANVRIEIIPNAIYGHQTEPIINPRIYNGTTAQKIGIEDTTIDKIYINTNVGQKSVEKEQMIVTEIRKNQGVNSLSYSDYYNKYFGVLHYQDIDKTYFASSDDCKTWNNILELTGGAGKIVIQKNIIYIESGYYEDGTYKHCLRISTNLTSWFMVETPSLFSSFDVMPLDSDRFLIVGKDYNTYKIIYGKLNISSMSVQEWINVSLGRLGTEYYCIDVLYNSHLNKIFVVVISTGYYHACWSTTNGSNWQELGEITHGENDEELTYIKETQEMVFYGSRYGFISTSVDGIHWIDRLSYSFYINDFKYIAKQKCYVVVGYRTPANASKAVMAISYDLDTWIRLPTDSFIYFDEYDQSTSSVFNRIVYNFGEDLFYVSGSYLNFQNQRVTIFSTILKYLENIIQLLTKNSDMNFKLAVGENNVYISDDFDCKLIYRQKYIGV